jgi:hypothetical protein
MLVVADNRFWFHQESSHEIEDHHGPESTDKEQNNQDDSNPENGEIEKISDPLANPHDDPASGSIKPSFITYIVESSHNTSPYLIKLELFLVNPLKERT